MKITRTLLFFIVLICCYYFGEAQYTNEGWTILDPQNAEKIIYVSTADGNDTDGIVYSFPSSTIGSDPIHPANAVLPFKTIAEALTHVNSGEAAWILLKRGDTFYETLRPKSGKSVQEPMVITSYGDHPSIPVLKTGAENGLITSFRGVSNAWIIGLSFYAHTRNPDSPEYINANGRNGIFIYANRGFTTENILVEGCSFRFYAGSSIQSGEGTVRNITFRRNLVLDNYNVDRHSQGLFASAISGIVLEENIFDHNGWYQQSYDNGQGEGQATIFNHNTYFSRVHDVVFKGNSFYRPSSIANKWTANEGIASATDITITQNFYHDYEVGISIGGNNREGPYRFRNITISDNVFNSPGLSQQTNRTLGWGIEIDDWDNGTCSHNILTHQKNANVTNGQGLIILGENRNVEISNNILNNLDNTHGIPIQTTDLENVRIQNNEFRLSLPAFKYFIRMPANLPSVFNNNTYNNLSNDEAVFRIGSSHRESMSFDTWITTTGETGATTTPLPYPDPDRSLERYITEVLSLDGLETFYSELRKQSILNWRPAYTATAINAWIKEGFGIESDTPPVVVVPEEPQPSTPDETENPDPEEIENENVGIPSVPSLFSTYPNPVNDMLIVNGEIKGEIRVYAASGQLVHTTVFQKNDTIDLSKLSPGTYYIQLLDEASKAKITEQYVKN